MNTTFPIPAEQRADVLADAVEDFRPAWASWRQAEGWATYETRFVSADPRAGELTVLYDASQHRTPDIREGQHVSVSFRHGRGRCAFDTVVLGHGRASVGGGRPLPILRLEYPKELCDLQRRACYRQPVSPSASVSVRLSVVPDGSAPAAASAGGHLIDISADGMSVGLPPGAGLPAGVDCLVDCELRVEGGSPAISILARICSRTQMPDGRVRLGLQFIGNTAADSGTDFARLLARVRT